MLHASCPTVAYHARRGARSGSIVACHARRGARPARRVTRRTPLSRAGPIVTHRPPPSRPRPDLVAIYAPWDLYGRRRPAEGSRLPNGTLSWMKPSEALAKVVALTD